MDQQRKTSAAMEAGTSVDSALGIGYKERQRLKRDKERKNEIW